MNFNSCLPCLTQIEINLSLNGEYFETMIIQESDTTSTIISKVRFFFAFIFNV